jgi:predicted secreted protein
MERGQDYIYQISADGVSYTTVGKLVSIELGREKDTIETNNFDSPDDAESIAGMKSWSLDGEALYVYNDAGQVIVEAAFASVAPYYHKLTSRAGTVGVIQFTGQGHVTELSLSFETNEVVAYSYSVQGTGVLARAAITT